MKPDVVDAYFAVVVTTFGLAVVGAIGYTIATYCVPALWAVVLVAILMAAAWGVREARKVA